MAKICSRVLAVRKNWDGNSDFDKIREYQGTSWKFNNKAWKILKYH